MTTTTPLTEAALRFAFTEAAGYGRVIDAIIPPQDWQTAKAALVEQLVARFFPSAEAVSARPWKDAQEVYDRMTVLNPGWNAYEASREAAVATALAVVGGMLDAASQAHGKNAERAQRPAASTGHKVDLDELVDRLQEKRGYDSGGALETWRQDCRAAMQMALNASAVTNDPDNEAWEETFGPDYEREGPAAPEDLRRMAEMLRDVPGGIGEVIDTLENLASWFEDREKEATTMAPGPAPGTTSTVAALPRYDIENGRAVQAEHGDYLIFDQVQGTLQRLTNPAGAEAPIAQIATATDMAFASTNHSDQMAGNKYWFAKGYKTGFAAAPALAQKATA